MTDRELLVLCADAFAAIPVAAKSRRLLIAVMGEDAPAYAGNRSHVLAGVMGRKIEEHLAAHSRTPQESST